VPLYEYQCGTCGRFEVIRKFSDEPLIICPTCGGEVHKLPSAPAIQFKGTGWYITDYARKSSGEASKDGGSKDGGTRTESGKSEGSKEASSSSSKDASSSSSKDASASKSTTAKETSSSGGGTTK